MPHLAEASPVPLALEHNVQTHDCLEVEKTQRIRLFDVLVLGPFMIWYANKTARHVPKLVFAFLLFAGVGTILYNLNNYLGTERFNKEA